MASTSTPAIPFSGSAIAHLFQAEGILETLGEGVALIDLQLRITWANLMFEAWCDGPVRGLGFYEALGSPQILGPDYSPFHTALGDGRAVFTRLHTRQNRYLELLVTPIRDVSGKVSQLICLCRDVTPLVQQQQKLDALHQAGRELAALAPDQLAEMSVEERIELLKLNIRRFTHDLLHYDVVEIRLLDRQTNRLEPLLEEGMTAEAAHRVLLARVRKATASPASSPPPARAIFAPIPATDPLYIEGAAAARSSITVPLDLSGPGHRHLQRREPRLNALHRGRPAIRRDFQPGDRRRPAYAGTADGREANARPASRSKRSAARWRCRWTTSWRRPPWSSIATSATTPRWAKSSANPGQRPLDQATHPKSRRGLWRRPVARTGPEASARPTLKGLRVLVADSDERVRRSAHGLLGRWGCVVETARDGKEALTMARLSTYDAILADIRLPDVSGYEAYQRLREGQPQARVILMTSFGYDPSHSHCQVPARRAALRLVQTVPRGSIARCIGKAGHDVSLSSPAAGSRSRLTE